MEPGLQQYFQHSIALVIVREAAGDAQTPDKQKLGVTHSACDAPARLGGESLRELADDGRIGGNGAPVVRAFDVGG